MRYQRDLCFRIFALSPCSHKEQRDLAAGQAEEVGSWLFILGSIHPGVLSLRVWCVCTHGGWRNTLVVAPLGPPNCIFWNGVSHWTWSFLSRLAQLASTPGTFLSPHHQCGCCDSKPVLPCSAILHGFWGSDSGPWAHEEINFLTAISRPCIYWTGGRVLWILLCSEGQIHAK